MFGVKKTRAKHNYSYKNNMCKYHLNICNPRKFILLGKIFSLCYLIYVHTTYIPLTNLFKIYGYLPTFLYFSAIDFLGLLMTSIPPILAICILPHSTNSAYLLLPNFLSSSSVTSPYPTNPK